MFLSEKSGHVAKYPTEKKGVYSIANGTFANKIYEKMNKQGLSNYPSSGQRPHI